MIGVLLFAIVAGYNIYVTINLRRFDMAREVLIYDAILILIALCAMRW